MNSTDDATKVFIAITNKIPNLLKLYTFIEHETHKIVLPQFSSVYGFLIHFKMQYSLLNYSVSITLSLAFIRSERGLVNGPC